MFLVAIKDQQVVVELWDLEKRVEEWVRMAKDIAKRVKLSFEELEESKEEWDYIDEEYARRKLGLP